MNRSTRDALPVDVSICILSWNTRAMLRRCLASLYDPGDPEVAAAWQAAGQPPAEIRPEGVSWEAIVVDQQSLDGSADMVEQEFPQARLIRQIPNLGFAGGNNRAIQEARGRYVLLLNSDTVVRPGWLETLVAYADAHPRAGLIGARLLNPDGSLQYSCRHFPRLLAGVFRHTPLEWLFPKNRFVGDYLMRDWDHATPRRVDWLSGACLMARMELVRDVGGLDEGYFMYFEDVDWAFRAMQKGWEVHYVPDAVVLHEVGQSSSRRPRRMIVMHHQSAYRYFSRHSRWGVTAPGRVVLVVGLIIRAMLTLARNQGITWKARLAEALREWRRRQRK